jgi:hypothetical protein
MTDTIRPTRQRPSKILPGCLVRVFLRNDNYLGEAILEGHDDDQFEGAGETPPALPGWEVDADEVRLELDVDHEPDA